MLFIRPVMGPRTGRPDLLGTVARTAVIAGTATVTANAVPRHGAQRAAEKEAYPGQLVQLKEAGALMDEEFTAAKAALLS